MDHSQPNMLSGSDRSQSPDARRRIFAHPSLQTGSPDALRAEVCRLIGQLESKSRELASGNRLSQFEHGGVAPLMFDLSALRRRLSGDAESLALIENVETGVLALRATFHALLTLTSGRKPKPQWINVRQVVEEVCASLNAHISAQRIETTVDVPGHLSLMADREMLRAAIMNLASNAVEAMPRGGRLVFTSYMSHRGVELEVADSGPGLSEEVAEQLFEPFFTTKSDAIGLGLAIVHRIAQAHHGEVAAANCPEGGAAFTLRLPRGARRAA
jgi:two-component system sensor histidine kinase HydH